MSKRTREANALLRAAAPDLLAAVEALLPMAELLLDIARPNQFPDLEQRLTTARAALAKAKGEAE